VEEKKPLLTEESKQNPAGEVQGSVFYGGRPSAPGTISPRNVKDGRTNAKRGTERGEHLPLVKTGDDTLARAIRTASDSAWGKKEGQVITFPQREGKGESKKVTSGYLKSPGLSQSIFEREKISPLPTSHCQLELRRKKEGVRSGGEGGRPAQHYHSEV